MFNALLFQKWEAWLPKMVNLDQMENRENVHKKKKNKRKLEEAETVQENENVVLESTEIAKPKKKKKNKDKETVQAPVEDAQESADEEQVASPFKKDFYSMNATTAALSKKEVKAYRQLHNITLYGKGRKEFKPLFTFDELGFPDAIMSICTKFEKPSPIQVWYLLL